MSASLRSDKFKDRHPEDTHPARWQRRDETRKSTQIMTRSIFIVTSLILIPGLRAQEPSGNRPVDDSARLVVEPANPSNKNPFTKVRNIIFQDREFEFAIMETRPTGYVYSLVVVYRDGGGFRCEDRTLDTRSAVKPDGRLDPDLLSMIKIGTRSKPIDPGIVAILRKEIDSMVNPASYQNHVSEPVPCDGCSYEVYCGNKAANVRPSDLPTFISPDFIAKALVQINASDNPSNHVAWTGIRTFLEARSAGKNPSPIIPHPPAPSIKTSDLPPP